MKVAPLPLCQAKNYSFLSKAARRVFTLPSNSSENLRRENAIMPLVLQKKELLGDVGLFSH